MRNIIVLFVACFWTVNGFAFGLEEGAAMMDDTLFQEDIGFVRADTLEFNIVRNAVDTGVVDIATFPDSVEILYDDHRYVSEFDKVLPVGIHKFHFFKRGFVPVDTVFAVRGGATSFYNVILVPSLLSVNNTKHVKRRTGILVMPQGGFNQDLSLGLMIGLLKRNGLYLRALVTLEQGRSSLTCNEKGTVLVEGHPYYPYYKSETSRPGFAVSAGYLRELWRPLVLYVGAGYGVRNVVWKTVDEVNVKNEELSVSGIVAECGAILRLGKLAVSCGVQTVGFSYSEIQFGLGVVF